MILISLVFLLSLTFLSELILAESLHMIAQTKKYSIGCAPTVPDAEGPFYKPNAPLRNSVGKGYALSGTVISSKDCSPIQQARLELWMAGPDGEYKDEFRATLIVNDSGEYRFESHRPPSYLGRPPHIHIRVTADGYQTLITQHYPAKGSSNEKFDLVLIPD
jgi:protocatechuate 3,4-dioxygenase beta subunit